MQVAFDWKVIWYFWDIREPKGVWNIVIGPVGNLYVMDNWVKTVTCDSGC